MASKPHVYSAFIAKTDQGLKERLLNGLEFIDWKERLKKDSVVFVKPNFTFPRYEKGVTTSPQLLKCLLEIIRERSGKVIVGESDGGNHSFKAEDAFAGHQMYEICRELGVDLVNLSKLPAKFVESKIQSKKVRVQLPRMLLEKADCLVSVPVFKVHVMTGVSLGLKNLWGCYPDTMRCLHHQNLDYKLALIAKALDPKITVIDGSYALDNHGPMFGDPLRMNMILTSNNVVVADALGAALMGVSLKRARHIQISEKTGIGTTDLEEVRVNTDWKPYGRTFRINKTLIDRASGLLFSSDAIAKFVMTSPFSPTIYKVAGFLRSSEEKNVVGQLKTFRNYM